MGGSLSSFQSRNAHFNSEMSNPRWKFKFTIAWGQCKLVSTSGRCFKTHRGTLLASVSCCYLATWLMREQRLAQVQINQSINEAHCELLCCVVQAEGGPSGSQGSRHSPGPVSQSPAKKQKTAPLVPPGATHIGDLLLSVCITIHALISMYIYTSINMYYYIHMCVYIYIYIKYIYIYTYTSNIYIYTHIYIKIKCVEGGTCTCWIAGMDCCMNAHEN